MSKLSVIDPFVCLSEATKQELIRLKSLSYSKLGVAVQGTSATDAKIVALDKITTGDLVFSCGGVTVFIAPQTLKKVGGLNILFENENWIFEKNNYKPFEAKPPEPKPVKKKAPKKSTKKTTAKSKPKTKSTEPDNV